MKTRRQPSLIELCVCRRLRDVPGKSGRGPVAVPVVPQAGQAQMPRPGSRGEPAFCHRAASRLHALRQELLHQEQHTEPHDLVSQGGNEV